MAEDTSILLERREKGRECGGGGGEEKKKHNMISEGTVSIL